MKDWVFFRLCLHVWCWKLSGRPAGIVLLLNMKYLCRNILDILNFHLEGECLFFINILAFCCLKLPWLYLMHGSISPLLNNSGGNIQKYSCSLLQVELSWDVKPLVLLWLVREPGWDLLTAGPLLVQHTPSCQDSVMLLGCEGVSSLPGISNDPTVRLFRSIWFAVVLKAMTHSN